jgi:hypothetical protein
VQRAGSFVVNHFLLWLFFGKPRGLEITSFKLFRKTAVEKLRPFLSKEGYLAGFILREVPQRRIVNSEACIHNESNGQSSYSWKKRFRLAATLFTQSVKLGKGDIPVVIDTFLQPR